jgi:hypothetical protein
MSLTAAQTAALKADILAQAGTVPAGQPWTNTFAGVQVKAVPNTADGNLAVAGWYNQAAVPAFTTWRKNVPIAEVGNKLNGTELAGLTSLNHTRLQTVVMLSQGGVDASLPDRRQFFDDIFSGAGGTITRGQLLALWKQLATYAQKLFSTGTGTGVGTDAATTAANIPDGFLLSGGDVLNALNL